MAKAKDGKNKAERLAEEVAKAVGAGKLWECETVDFNDPNRPPTCIEVDFPIIPINQIAQIEGNAGKPIYQMSKWWARRRSSVFRSMLLASAIKAPSDAAEAAKKVWETYYGNHQKKGAFKHLKVADIFMGGGTTVVEGSRLGMQMFGNDLNPVAWFVVKNEMAQVSKTEIKDLLAVIEAEVKPQIIPFYTCACPRGHKGKWTQASTGNLMGSSFDPLALTPDQRKDYRYEGPEIIYVFWAKHGPCQVTGCGHRTPIMSSPVMAIKELSIKYWSRVCKACGGNYDIEERDARMAPGVPLVIASTERPFAVAKLREGKTGLEPESAVCPCCGKTEEFQILGKGTKKKVELSLLVHPDWLKGESCKDPQGRPYGGSADDDVDSTIRWNQVRAKTCQLVEVRGKLPDVIKCPTTGIEIVTNEKGGNVPKKSHYSCGSCGTIQDVLKTVKATKKTGPIANYAVQGYCPQCDKAGEPYGGRFFIPMVDTNSFDTAFNEWHSRKDTDLSPFWPRSELSLGWKTHGWAIPDHGFTHYWKMFNHRQLFVHAHLLKAILTGGKFSWDCREAVLGAFQQYLRNQNMFCFWNISADKLEPHFSNNNYHPKSLSIENCVFSCLGRGNWVSSSEGAVEGNDWRQNPWEPVSVEMLNRVDPTLGVQASGKSEKVYSQDPMSSAQIWQGSSTELAFFESSNFDLVITDPPFGEIMQYAELADFFYVWLRISLKDKYPEIFGAEHSPKAMEVVANPFRVPDNPEGFYKRLLTQCWLESNRILKIGGVLAFTFHHSEDAPWVSVLESLFDAGFYLHATYPIRSDETKGDKAQFGSQKIEYDIIHVCRKRYEEPKPISWAKLRRQVLQDVRDLQSLLEHHQKAGLPAADLQVIRRGKALEYYSRHYGKVFKDQGVPMSVLEALLGINQLLDEETGGTKEPPPHNAEPFTRMLLRLFDGKSELERDQIQKFLRGSGSAPSDFVDRGWVHEEKKIFYLRSPLNIAREWVGKHRKGMTSDYDQAMYFIGACFEASGINASETLNNSNFQPHPALGALLTWFKTHGSSPQIRNAAVTASMLYHNWESKNQAKAKQLSLFDLMGEDSVNG